MTEDYTIEKALIDAHNPSWINDNTPDIWTRVWCHGKTVGAMVGNGAFAVGRDEKGWRVWRRAPQTFDWPRPQKTTFDEILRLLSDPEYQQRYGITP